MADDTRMHRRSGLNRPAGMIDILEREASRTQGKSPCWTSLVWASRKLVDFLYRTSRKPILTKCTSVVGEETMPKPRAADPPDALQPLVAELQQLIEAELLEMVRTLQQAGPDTLFGHTEFQIRGLALKIAAKAYQQRLAQK